MFELNATYQALRQPLHQLLLILLVMGVLVGATGYFHEYMKSRYENNRQTLNDTISEYRQSLRDEKTFRTQTSHYEILINEGFVGPEPRLRWIKDVRDAAERTEIKAIRYNLGPRVADDMFMPSSSFQLFSSVMQLNLELHHEGDLLTFLEILRGRRSGLFEVHDCTLDRVNATNTENQELLDGIKTTCHLVWYSLDAPEIIAEGEAW